MLLVSLFSFLFFSLYVSIYLSLIYLYKVIINVLYFKMVGMKAEYNEEDN